MSTHNLEQARSHHFRTAFILGSLSAFGPLSIDMYLPSLPGLTDDLHTVASLAQLSITACLLGLATGQLIAGPLSDIHGRRKPLLIALVFYAIASVICAISPSIWILILFRFIQGLCGAAGIVISRAVARDLFSGTNLTKFFSLLMLVNGVAPILAPIIGGQLLNFVSWRGVFIVLTVVGALMLIGVAFALPETLQDDHRTTGGLKQTLTTFGKLLSDRFFMGYAVSRGFIMAAMFAYISGSPFVIQKIYGMSPQFFSLCFAVNGLGIIIASQTVGRLAGRVKETTLFRFGTIYATVGGVLLFIAVALHAGMWVILAALFIVVSSVGIVSTSGFSIVMDNQEKSAGSASALLGLIQFAFGALIAPLVGVAGEQTALPMGIVIGLCDVMSLLLYVILIVGRKKTFKSGKTASH